MVVHCLWENSSTQETVQYSEVVVQFIDIIVETLSSSTICLVLGGGFLAMASPGPATIAISRASMSPVPGAGMRVAIGVSMGSIIWCVAAASGFGALMLKYSLIMEALRYGGAVYLSCLAIAAFRRAIAQPKAIDTFRGASGRAGFWTGLCIHLGNPKPVIFYGALFSTFIPPSAGVDVLAIVVVALCLLALVVFGGLAIAFSHPAMGRLYVRFQRSLEALFALMFGAASIKLFATPLSPSMD
jgi:threonine/homoserine/homoserine lactone efflux protein